MDHSTPFAPWDKTASRFLYWYLLVRPLVMALFLGGSIINQLRSAGANSQILGWFYLLAALCLIQSLIFFALFGRSQHKKVLLRWQICWDLLFATALIFLAGGIVSHLSFLYIFIIFSVSIFLSRHEVFVAASAAAILYGGLLDLQYYSVLPVVSSIAVSSQEIFYDIFINVIVFYLIAFLSSLLAERLRYSELALKKREIDFEELENLNQIILENVPSGLIIINNSGRIRSFNAGAATITGYALEAIYNRSITELFPDMNVLEGGDFKPVDRGETRLVDSQGGQRSVGFTSSVVRDVSGETLCLLITFQDLTLLKEMENQLKRADRLAAVGQLAAGMAHEIRNPLASISGSVQLLMEGESLEQEDRCLMGIVVREAERLNALLTDFLVFARPSPPCLEPVDVAELLDELVSMVSADERFKNIELQRDYKVALEWHCDRGQLRQALWNLLVNGAEAMENGGRLTCGLDSEVPAVFIEDTGPGIPDAIRDKVFDPFFTTKDSGTGLGLATVHSIVEAHHGRLDLIKAVNGGERFVISMPASAVMELERAV
ncbi:MAG: hypothetical protein BA869_08950 [Desulfuromonadales bacterium C00003107]|jgi:two-component system sensor histidine kinase PilS (NtrC family)|nr:MAG: hypothetical protein BA869_08950 [Desulfuromonadales bacterium C00003107]